jgi:signal transduction histidine kinase
VILRPGDMIHNCHTTGIGHLVKSIDQKKMELRELVIDQVKWFSLILGCLTFFDTIKLQFLEQKYLLVGLYSIIFAAAIAMLFFKWIPTQVRVYVLVLAIYLVGVLALIDEGIIGSGPLWLLAFPAVTAAIVGKWRAVAAIVISFVTAMIYLYFSDVPTDFPADLGIDYITHGLDQAFDLLLLSFVASIPAAILFDKVNLQLVKEQEQSQQLSDAIHQLIDANKDLGAFAHTVSHDLRAPIRHIHSYARLAKKLQESGDMEALGTSLTRISDAAEKSSNLVEQILRFSTLENQELNEDNLELSMIVRSAFATLKSDPRYKRTEVDVAQGCQVEADRDLLTIMVNNLASNAFKYSHTVENPRVEFGHKEIEGQTVFFIKDNGVGFNPEMVSRLFEPFSRLHTSRDFEGFGVGLATVKKVVDKHGGKIWAESAEGQGACFYFSFI